MKPPFPRVCRFHFALLLVVALFGLGACGSLSVRDGAEENAKAPAATESAPETKAAPASAPETPADAANDPLEGFNRTMYSFNDKFYRYVLDPVSRAYRAVLPDAVRLGVSNFFGNLHDPVIMVNNVLQGKLLNAASDLGRFIVNTTVGIAGLFDVARHIGLDKHDEDFGQTLAVWGVGEGPYLVLPILGPSSVRDGLALVPDLEMYPVTHIKDRTVSYSLFTLETINRRTQLLDAGDILEQAAGQDPYVFVREAYRQSRRNLVYDGNPPAPPPDPSLFEDDTPAPKKPEQGATPKPNPAPAAK